LRCAAPLDFYKKTLKANEIMDNNTQSRINFDLLSNGAAKINNKRKVNLKICKQSVTLVATIKLTRRFALPTSNIDV
jgi:hypothetical protein